MRFADPYWLLLAPLVVLLVLRRRRQRPALLFSSVAELAALPRTFAQRVRAALPWLEIAGLLLLVVALARPQAGREDSVVSSHGVAIELVLDKSQSMEAQDLDPDPWDRVTRSRLDVVKEVVADFIDLDGNLPGRPTDLIGLVSFAGWVQSHCPLTLDHAAVLRLLQDVQLPNVDPRDPSAGEVLRTAIGDGLVTAVDRLRDAPAKSKVAVLLSDGVSNIGEASPRAAAELARASDVRVYTIGVGTARDGLDEDALREVAEITGGRYFNARDAESLANVYREIDGLERTELEAKLFVRWSERNLPFLLLGIALLVAHRLLLDTRFRSLP